MTEDDLPDLARGAAVLGTGGGGDPYVGRLMVRQAIREHGPVTVLDPDEVADDALVIPTAQMGAPTVMFEKLPAGDRADRPRCGRWSSPLGRTRRRDHADRVRRDQLDDPAGRRRARLGLPVVDADGMGRAFPELQMETFGVYGVPGSPMASAASAARRP